MNSVGKILYAEKDGVHVLKFVGDVRLTLGPTITTFLEHLRSCEGFKSIVVDMSETEGIDSTALGLLAKVAICSKESFDSKPSIVCPNHDITRLLRSMAIEQVCVLLEKTPATNIDLAELPGRVVSEEVMRDEVIDAHKVLMSLDVENQGKFKDLVDALEEEKSYSMRRHPLARTG